MTKQYYKDNLDGTYSLDVDGGIAGIEFTKDSKTFVTLSGTAWNAFDFALRKAELVFKRFIKVEDVLYYKGSVIKTIDDSKYMYDNPLAPTFGQYEDFPFDGNNELKEDLITEAQFFINTIIQNKWGIPLGIGQFQYATIMRMEEINEIDN